MREVPGQLPFAKHTTRRAIHFGGSRARPNSRDGGLLRFQNSFVQPPSFSRGPSDMHSSRAIRTITGEYNTKIADHEPAPWNARAGGPAMHDCRARSGSEYRRKGHAFGPGTTGLVLHSGGDFDFSHTLAEFSCMRYEKDWRRVQPPAGCAGSRQRPSPCGHARPAVARNAGAPSLSAPRLTGRACRQ